MKRNFPFITFAVMTMAAFGFSASIVNVKFKDMTGKQYDLYQVLGQGKHVLVHAMWSG